MFCSFYDTRDLIRDFIDTFASGFQSLFLRGNTGGPFSYFQSLGTRLAPPAAIVVVFGAGLIIFGLAFIFAPAGEPDGNAAGPTGTENVDPDSGETTGFTGPSTAEVSHFFQRSF